jgi:hypothetical protein
MGLLLIIIWVFSMMLWLFSALPLSQAQPYAWVHPIVAWVAVAILGYIVFSGAPVAFR